MSLLPFFARAVGFAVAVATATVATRGADSAPSSKTAPNPAIADFSWDRVPVNIHFGKRGADMTDAELKFIATHSDIVTLEKGHGAKVHGSTEAGIADTARRLKQLNPRLKVFFYLNAFINWPGYESYRTYNPEWTLRSRTGQIVTHPSGAPRPDPSNPAFRAWWSDVVATELRRGPIDGVFADALPQAFQPALAETLGAAKARAVIDDLREMLALTKRKIGPDKLVLANGTRATKNRELLDWEGIDGVMIEHFDSFETRAPEDLRADLETLAIAARKGKFVSLKAWPGFTWLDKDVMRRPHTELLRMARQNITFPLACFLIGAQRGSYFCYAWGYTEKDGGLDAYPELERPLGPPQGEAVWHGLTATRTFAHAAVWVDLEHKQARINWSN